MAEPKDAEDKANESKAAEMIAQQGVAAQAQAKLTLKIWDVPNELANRFISNAKARYGGKSWLYLKALMDNELSDELLRTKLDLIESRQRNVEGMLGAILETPESEKEKEPEAPKPIRTFGGGKMERKGED